MKGILVKFKNIPRSGGEVEDISVEDCLVAQVGSPATNRPRLTIHLPKTFEGDITQGWVEYEGNDYHVVGVTAPGIKENVPTRWNRYAVAERVY